MSITITGKNNVGHTVVAKNGDFLAAFASEQDAQDFIGLCEARDAKNRDAMNRGTLSELEARFPQDFRNPE